MADEEKTDLGLIKIHNNVIASISYLAALEIEGVSRICEDTKSRIATLLGKKTTVSQFLIDADIPLSII